MTAEQELVIKQVVPFPPRRGFADLFLDPAERKAFKLFKNHKHPNVCPERGTKEDDLRRLMFEAEKQAYEIATADEHLKTYSPVFYGARNVSRVVALNGRDITEQYLLECCLELEMLEGKDVKFENVRNRFEQVEKLFNRAGIRHTKDMSAFVNVNRSDIKLIDFAVRDAYAETENQWIINGKIN